ncbi:hypothetical protein AGMMS50230_12980 [Spirochaetia bacterium]|nr:hypothetical protein AGMMS50230_12980 [Spirochaetia bacterium]
MALFILGEAGQIHAASLADLVGTENAAALKRGEKLTRVQAKNPSAILIPRDQNIKDLTSRIIREQNPSFFVETLSLYRKPSAAPWTDGQRTSLFNQTLSLSSLAGLQYYSIRRKQMHTFYETSTVVSGPDGASPQPDPSYTNPPAELTIYARQKDNSFGDNVYRYDYYARPDSLIFVQENLTDMSYGIIPAIAKNKLRSIVAVYDADEYLLLYAVSIAKASSFPGLNDRIGGSFSNRAEAIFNWFSGRADKVFKP